MEKYIVLDKKVGETPLSCTEAWRAKHPAYADVPLAYAGRLDPMASGKLLILIGDECKHQTDYHNLDKEYKFSVLFGIESDSLDVLGRLKFCPTPKLSRTDIRDSAVSLIGNIELPYPRFSAKTVRGKPLHMWTLEGKLDEIEIPTKHSEIYSLTLENIEERVRTHLVEAALQKVNSIPEVTDPKKALGNNFRRTDVRSDWESINKDNSLPETFQIAHFTCIASSGTYMRTLASIISNNLGTCGLAWSIHRTEIGVFDSDKNNWTSTY